MVMRNPSIIAASSIAGKHLTGGVILPRSDRLSHQSPTSRGLGHLTIASFRSVVCVLAVVLACGNAARPEQNAESIKKLTFLTGSWQCRIRGNRVPEGDTSQVTYEFSPDRSWMIERSLLRERGHNYWAIQLWGYDAQNKKLTAYQFNSAGVFTKTVSGWLGSVFYSKRNYDGATVMLKRTSRAEFVWIVNNTNPSSTVTESCRRATSN
jgi:hypothetical protein